MHREIDVNKLVLKVEKEIENELIELFKFVNLDVSECASKMYKVYIRDNELIIDFVIPYANIIELGVIEYEKIDVSKITDWYIENVKDDLSKAVEFAEKYLSALYKNKGLYLSRKIEKMIIDYNLG